ncbi:phBC6A51 family helix-turn-helix protein [Desulfosporosinus sp. Sb-LF]|uniref:phBC6A51 family helix-turn-helix protein n=1 Tax=Desulfosporosinus sp. Sb-LF TaxID=2560027 RepID=UPI00107F9B1E|nr:phBC6A51 family helix-turn-helix protein [Desulfosporosinus sp. Sb-LF]TGE32861.1 hypothetical protein E4K68_08405 [Desulfosporosinus sp. Sb-LF]
MNKPTRIPSIAKDIKGLPSLTPTMIICAEMIIQKRGQSPSYDEIAKTAGISTRQLHRYRLENEDFQNYVRRRSLVECNLLLPQIMSSLTENAISGNVRAAELVLKSLGMLLQSHEISVSPIIDRSTETINIEIQELKERLGLNDKPNINEMEDE